ncbi:MAG: phosphate acyltransferase [Patescibacteria group bacterium]
MKIVLDVMGGDFGPEPIVRGALEALWRLPFHDFEIVLVGDQAAIKELLQSSKYARRYRAVAQRISIIHARSVITMADKPDTVNGKTDSSISAGLDLVRSGIGTAFISTGNTGAVVTCAAAKLGLIEGLFHRPAIGTLLPTLGGQCIMLDSGATTDCKPRHLVQYAILGALYVERVLKVRNPRIGILNNGAEDGKGNRLTKDSLAPLRQVFPEARFVEGHEVALGAVDVCATDGFVGNVVLKSYEGLYFLLKRILSIVPRWKRIVAAAGLVGLVVPPALVAVFEPTWFLLTYIPAWLAAYFAVKPVYSFLKQRFDWREHGGGPLLGVNGTVIIAHGRSPWKAIVSAVRQARLMALSGINSAIRESLAAQ